MEKTGYNINNYINTFDLCSNFLKYYMDCINTDPYIMINDGVIKEYTTFNYNGNIYNKENMLTLMEMFKNSNINITNFQSLESGSRRIDLLLCGVINENQFTQSMTICHLNETWFIKNSIILM